MTISTNQNRHFYVVNAFKDLNAAQNPGTISDKGDIGIKVVGTGNEKELVLLYKGEGGLQKSDRIQVKNLDYGKALAPADMIEPLKKVKVTLASGINSGNPVTGEDYVLRIVFKQFYGMSDEDQYIKDAVVHATAAMEADKKEFYKAMVDALNLAFSREVNATKTENPYLSFSAGTTGSEDGIYITEKPQEWNLGIEAQEHVDFEVYPTSIMASGVEYDSWGTLTDQTPTKANAVAGTTGIGNGHKIADLEWFCMGERGDQYRMQGWPNYIPTKYMVTPSSEYYVLELHHAFTDTGVNSYRSEKDITIVSTVKAAINGLINAINTAAGTSIATLS